MDYNLLMAVLSLNSYEDGNDIKDIGLATNLEASLPSGSSASGFSARAYSYNGETIISYRGTDGAIVGDAWYGYATSVELR